MDTSKMEHALDSDLQEYILNFCPEVQEAIREVFPSNDPLDEASFNSVNYINSLFPTEQSLSNIDEVITKFETKIVTIDNEIGTVIHNQTQASEEGKVALEESQTIIKTLFVHIKEIKEQAERSEEMVREITRDIKQLDCAKRNLTHAITTLNHLHMLVGGVENLKELTQRRLYGEIALPLQAISEVMTYFESYTDIPQIKKLSDEVKSIRVDLAEQITRDFKDAFSSTSARNSVVPNKQLAQACLVVSVLDTKVKKDLLKWFVDLQLQEYNHLFEETEDTAWLDKIDKRYAWLKRHLLEFEDRLGSMFPPNWEVSERIAVQFAHKTREDLIKIMAKRRHEIDCKLLLFAIQKTSTFENLLSRRFTGITIKESNEIAVTAKGPTQEYKPTDHEVTLKTTDDQSENQALFAGLIGKCFIPHLEIYVDSVDRNLSELIERFVIDEKQQTRPTESTETQAAILPSCPDLFVFYKKTMIQCTQLDNEKTLLSLTKTFQKYLLIYAERLLMQNLPKFETQSLGSSVQSLTRDLQKMSTSGLIQNFSSLLKEGEVYKFSKEEQTKICCILTTAEYCLDTTQQLQLKLKEKIDSSLAELIQFNREEESFEKVISSCIHILVQDLENACEPALTAMSKIQWQSVDAVGDQSPYITSITTHLKNNVPVIRNNLFHSRGHFTKFCTNFSNSFIPKFVQTIYKCKPINTEGAEQLLLDTHMLKTVLLNLPAIASHITRPPPAPYATIVTKGMTKAEMILKVVMTPIEPHANFVEQYHKLLTDCAVTEFYKVLDMKGIKRQEQAILVDLFKSKQK